MRLLTTIASALALGLASLTLAKEGKDVAWQTSFAKAQELAKESGRPILIDFTGSDWCGWCIKLDKEVFSQKEFQAYAKENLILMDVDFPKTKKLPAELKRENQKLAEKYNVRGYPTIILVDADGKILAETGYQRGGAAKYVEHIKSLLAKKSA